MMWLLQGIFERLVCGVKRRQNGSCATAVPSAARAATVAQRALRDWPVIAWSVFVLGAGLSGAARGSTLQADFKAGGTPTPRATGTVAASTWPLHFLITRGSYVELDGTATIGSWYSRSTAVHGDVVLDISRAGLRTWLKRLRTIAARPDPPTGAGGAPDSSSAAVSTVPALPLTGRPRGDISIATTSLRSDNRGRDHDLHAALKARRYPTIQYTFEKVENATIPKETTGPEALKLAVTGRLFIAGRRRVLTTDMLVQPQGHGRFHIQARSTIGMRNFGITPPSTFFGLIRANNRVSVIFSLNLALCGRPLVATDTPRRP